MATLSVIIPTYNRLDDLTRCIRSILSQSRLPEELIVVDDGDLGDMPLREECERTGIRCLYEKKAGPRGQTDSKNQGVRDSSGEVLIFLDDDTELLPGFIEALAAPYEDDDSIGGVAGTIENMEPLRGLEFVRYVFDCLFLTSGFREGRTLPSGFCVDFGRTPFPIRRPRDVEIFPGGAASYRREAFEDFRFTSRYRDYAFGEDKDFSYRVSKRWRLISIPEARLNHFESPSMRPDRRLWGRKVITGRYLFFMFYKRHWWTWPLFWHSVIGYSLVRAAIAALRREKGDWQQFRGALDAIGDILKRRVDLTRPDDGGVLTDV